MAKYVCNVTREIDTMEDRYRKVLEKGKPKHEPYDDFYMKHPPMNLSRRAKIFSPFDALKGYDEKIAKLS